MHLTSYWLAVCCCIWYVFIIVFLIIIRASAVTNNCFSMLHPAAISYSSTAVNKSAHINKPQRPPYEEYGWALNAGGLVPVTSTAPAWPESMTKNTACGCTKGSKNCSCMKKNVSCYRGCRCRETVKYCNWMQHAEAVFSDSTDSDND